MVDTSVATRSTRLRTLLEGATSGVGDEILAEARALGPHASAAVASVIEAELPGASAFGPAVRAAHIARELGLAGAIPALVRSIELLGSHYPLRRAALAAVPRLGAAAVDALLAAFGRAATAERRAKIAEALARTTVDDDRVPAAFVRMLEDDAVNGARCLAEHGDWCAVADLARAADRLLRSPPDDCPVCVGQQLRAIASAVRVLGGTLSVEQLRGMRAILERAEASWILPEDPFTAPDVIHLPATPGRRPGRNDPCPCGSGRKYRKCHLDADLDRMTTHDHN